MLAPGLASGISEGADTTLFAGSGVELVLIKARRAPQANREARNGSGSSGLAGFARGGAWGVSEVAATASHALSAVYASFESPWEARCALLLAGLIVERSNSTTEAFVLARRTCVLSKGAIGA